MSPIYHYFITHKKNIGLISVGILILLIGPSIPFGHTHPLAALSTRLILIILICQQPLKTLYQKIPLKKLVTKLPKPNRQKIHQTLIPITMKNILKLSSTKLSRSLINEGKQFVHLHHCRGRTCHRPHSKELPPPS